MTSKKHRSRSKLIVWILVLFGLGLFIWNFYSSQANAPVDQNGKDQIFTVTAGESVSEIASQLASQKIIRSSDAFKSDLKAKGADSSVQAGDFTVSAAKSTDQIAQIFADGPAGKWVTLIEGWRDEEMADKLSQEIGINSSDFIKNAKEGYMFPDTYLFKPTTTLNDVISKLEENFNKKYDQTLQNQVKSVGLTPDQGVILASIVEREARSDTARQMVASILLKRFKIGMVLNVDASVQYALGYQKSQNSWWKKALSLEDLKIDSPYNTYVHAGLPPGPISNPSLSSLQAVAKADPNTPYLYYYDDSEGVAHYAKTLDEQNANVVNYP